MPRYSQLPIDGGYYESDSLPLAAQNCVNLYPVNPQTKGSLSKGSLFRTPGIKADHILGTGPGRGFYKFLRTDTVFAVSGTQLFSRTADGPPVLHGTIEGTNRVSMVANANTLCIIVPGGIGYFFNIGGTLEQISDPVFTAFQAQPGGVSTVTLKDNRFVYTTNIEFFVGSLPTVNNGKDFDALDFEDADVKSDPIQRALTIHNELHIFGSETIELYQSTGGSGFPFQRVLGATINKGISSRFGVIEFDNAYVFLGAGPHEAPAIWRGSSGSASKLSTSAIDAAIQRYSIAQIESVFAWSYTENGSTFVGFTFPDETLVYDATASALQERPIWHQRKSNGSRWRVNDIITIFGKVIVSDQNDGITGLLSRDFLSEYSTDIQREFTGIYLSNTSQSYRISSLELKTTSGVGTNQVLLPSSDPMIDMSYSDNGGNTFLSSGKRAIGKLGEFNKRQIWRRLGRVPHNRMFRFTTSDPVAVDFLRLDIGIAT